MTHNYCLVDLFASLGR